MAEGEVIHECSKHEEPGERFSKIRFVLNTADDEFLTHWGRLIDVIGVDSHSDEVITGL